MSISLHTNYGDIKIELFCHEVPKTCKNFLALCASGYYDNTKFHRYTYCEQNILAYAYAKDKYRKLANYSHNFLFMYFFLYRNIKGFAIQGGDPTNTGKGGESIYGKYFDDEFDSTLKVRKRITKHNSIYTYK
ncbi:peptidyl-prolyl cis-trans isomerase [Plasmodium yoelii yoelii]|uniref:peptidylprolyl isomerase n=1 Tax=Plasmodium yoelii yoelii TaxID=73239 RepID=A0AAE9WVE6_PLAYO|nr:peptidyl-prolyl cis-trans isomerase [Plasmodium yoelii yoelii]